MKTTHGDMCMRLQHWNKEIIRKIYYYLRSDNFNAPHIENVHVVLSGRQNLFAPLRERTSNLRFVIARELHELEAKTR